MGLAAYGKPIYKNKLLEIIDYNGSEINLKRQYFNHFNSGSVSTDWNNGTPKILKLWTEKWINLFGKSYSLILPLGPTNVNWNPFSS